MGWIDLASSSSSEDLFLSWLMRLPEGADVARAARAEIARLDATEPTTSLLRLRNLLVQASVHSPVQPGRQRRVHH